MSRCSLSYLKIVQKIDLAREMRIYFHFRAQDFYLSRTQKQIKVRFYFAFVEVQPILVKR